MSSSAQEILKEETKQKIKRAKQWPRFYETFVNVQIFKPKAPGLNPHNNEH